MGAADTTVMDETSIFARSPLSILSRSDASLSRFAASLLPLVALVFLAFYQHPDVLASLEVDWAGRAATLVARRAELLHGRAG